VVQSVAGRDIHLLLGLHGALHDGVVRFEGLHVLFVIGKDLLLDALAEAVLGHLGDDGGGVLLLDHDPSRHLVHGENVGAQGGVQFLRLHHALANGG